jgi:AraC family transcriptional regulator, transcriptional activator of pobA
MNTTTHSLLSMEQVLKVYESFHKKNPIFGMDVLANNFSAKDIVILYNDTKEKQGHPIRFDFFALFLCIEGKAKSSVNQYTFDIAKNSLQLILPGSIFSFETYAEELESYILLFTKDFLFCDQNEHQAIQKLITFHEQNINNITLPSNIFTQVKMLYEHIDLETKSENSDYREMIRLYIVEMLYILKRGKLLNQQHVNVHVHTRAEQITSHYLELIEKHFLTQKSVKAYANMLNITSKHLSETIKATTQKSALSFIHARIIKEIVYLLTYTHCSLKQIAAALNFSTQTTCSRFFRQYYKISPKQYRLAIKL